MNKTFNSIMPRDVQELLHAALEIEKESDRIEKIDAITAQAKAMYPNVFLEDKKQDGRKKARI